MARFLALFVAITLSTLGAGETALGQSTFRGVKAIYNFDTGNITFNGVEEQFINQSFTLRLFSIGGNLIPNVGNDLDFPLTEQTATHYSWAEFGPGPTRNDWDAGNIVVPGTDPDDLFVDWVNCITCGHQIGQVCTIPEPNSLALLSLATVGLLTARRKRV